MSTTNRSLRIAFTATILAAAGAFIRVSPAPADAGAAALKSDSRLWLVGDSTLHVYHSTATVLNSKLGWSEPPAAPGDVLGRLTAGKLTQLELSVPVDALKSGKAGLDRNLQKTLRSATYPDITFQMKSYTTETTADGTRIRALGTVATAGGAKDVTIDGALVPTADGVRVQGMTPLLMTDFGIKPPSILGLVRTANEIDVHFDVLVGVN